MNTYNKLKALCDTWGVKIQYEDDLGWVSAEQGVVNLPKDLSDKESSVLLSHEMGHLVLFMQGNVEKTYPHLTYFKKHGKHLTDSKKYCDSLVSEEKQAWVVGKNLYTDHGGTDLGLFFKIRDKSLKTYTDAQDAAYL